MTGYLLDTNAVSLLAPRSDGKNLPSRGDAFQEWVREHKDNLFLSVITLAELQVGISRLERRNLTRRASDLTRWLQAILELYDSRILSLTAAVALQTGRLLDRAIGKGIDAGFEDAAIAATASVHDLTVVTANLRHFEAFGVQLIAPPA